MAHDVFISYSTKDRLIADAVSAALEKALIRFWVAPRDVIPGRAYAGQITRAIEGSRVMVLLFSANSNVSEDVLREVQLAARAHVHILNFKIEDVAPSDDMDYYLSVPHWIDAMTAPLEGHLERLVKALQTLTPSDAPPAPVVSADRTELPPVPVPVEKTGDALVENTTTEAAGEATTVLVGPRSAGDRADGPPPAESFGVSEEEVSPRGTEISEAMPDRVEACESEADAGRSVAAEAPSDRERPVATAVESSAEAASAELEMEAAGDAETIAFEDEAAAGNGAAAVTPNFKLEGSYRPCRPDPPSVEKTKSPPEPAGKRHGRLDSREPKAAARRPLLRPIFAVILGALIVLVVVLSYVSPDFQSSPGTTAKDLVHAQTLNARAWRLATSREASERNGEEAVRLAKDACARSGFTNADFLDTLAAAYAETGQWALAKETAQRAVQLGSSLANKALVQQLRDHLEMFELEFPLRENDAKK